MFYRAPTNEQWAAQRVAALPARWQGRLLGAWERQRKQRTPGGDWTEEQAAQRRANLALLHMTEQLQTLRSLPQDAEDLHVCQVADHLADKCMGSGQLWGGQFGFDVRHIRQAMAQVCVAHGVEPRRISR